MSLYFETMKTSMYSNTLARQIYLTLITVLYFENLLTLKGYSQKSQKNKTVHNFFGYVSGLRRKLQCSTLDIVERYILINIIKCLVKLTRDDEKKSDTVFEKDMTMAAVIDGIMASRRCGSQTQRSNIPADYAKVYFRHAVFLPCLDSMIQQCNIRFDEHVLSFIKASALIPSNIHQTSDYIIQRLFQTGVLTLERVITRQDRPTVNNNVYRNRHKILNTSLILCPVGYTYKSKHFQTMLITKIKINKKDNT